MNNQTPMTPPEDAAANRRSSRCNGSAAVLREIAAYQSNSTFASDLLRAADELDRLLSEIDMKKNTKGREPSEE